METNLKSKEGKEIWGYITESKYVTVSLRGYTGVSHAKNITSLLWLFELPVDCITVFQS